MSEHATQKQTTTKLSPMFREHLRFVIVHKFWKFIPESYEYDLSDTYYTGDLFYAVTW